MEVQAIAKNIRVSPLKVRLVAAQIKKMQPQDAIKMLEFVPKSASMPLKKVIASAIANAKNNYNLAEETLKFEHIIVGKGQVFKRFRPVARGRAHSILKRTSNIRVVITGEEHKKESEVSEGTKGAKGSEGTKGTEVTKAAEAAKDKNKK